MNCVKTTAIASVTAVALALLLFLQVVASRILYRSHRYTNLGSYQQGSPQEQLSNLQLQHHFSSLQLLAISAVKAGLITRAQANRLPSWASIRSSGSASRTAGWAVFPVALLLLVWPLYYARGLGARGDPLLVPLALTLCMFNLIDLMTLRDPIRDTPLTIHQTWGIIAGIVVFLLLSRLPEPRRRSLRFYPYVWGLSALAIFLLLLLFGHGPGGVRLELGPLQPIEIAKLLLVLFAAAYLTERSSAVAERQLRTPVVTYWRDLGPLLLLFGLSLVLFYICRDMGPGLLLFAVLAAMITITTGKPQFAVAGIALIGVGGVLGYLAHVGVFPVRVDMWLHPFANRYPQGMQLGQGLWGFSSSGAPGSGFGMGMPAAIPRAQDDLSFASWGEQSGWPGSIAVLIIFAVLVARSIKIGTRAGHPFDRALAYGIGVLFGLQTLLIVGGVTGIIPLTGLSLPFFSYGDSALLLDFAALGFLQSISQSKGSAAPITWPVQRAANTFSFCCSVLLVGVVGIVRLGYVQIVASDSIAIRSIVTPDRDGIARPHINPRLLLVANSIHRGNILDRAGRVLASSTTLTHSALRSSKREYPLGAAAAQVTGYFSRETGAVAGLEARNNHILSGYTHIQDLLPYYRDRFMPGAAPPIAHNIFSTVSRVVQKDAYNSLKRTCARLHKSNGALVVIDADTGDILAEVSLPALTPGSASRGTGFTPALVAVEHPLVNRAVDGRYPPGSTFKLATAACALQDVPGSARLSVACNRRGIVRWHAGGHYFSRIIHDDIHDPAFGNIGMDDAFTVSSNIYFATLAAKIGANSFRQFLLEGAFPRVPALSSFRAQLADIGYGQGQLEVSPLQMALLAATVAGNGLLPEAHLVTATQSLLPGAKIVPISHLASREWFSPQVATTIQRMMVDVATRGTAAGLFTGLPGNIGAKTGTAQVGPGHAPHSWFVGFAHVNALPHIRQIAFACIIEHGGYGRTGAGAACAQLLRQLDK